MQILYKMKQQLAFSTFPLSLILIRLMHLLSSTLQPNKALGVNSIIN